MSSLGGPTLKKNYNNTYLNVIEIFNKLFIKINIIKMRNLAVTSLLHRLWKKGNFRLTGKITTAAGKSKCRFHFD